MTRGPSLALSLLTLAVVPIGRSQDHPPPVHFDDVTVASGIDFVHENSPTTSKYLIETMGGGVALLDYDNDGWLDVFFTNGAQLADPMPAGAQPIKAWPRFANRLYRGGPGGRFSEVTSAAGLASAQGYGMGVAVGDYDNDGFADLYVTNFGANILYHNDGHGRFVDVTARAGVAAGGWSASAAFVDYDNDGQLDLFVTRYVDFSFENNPYCGERRLGYREYCHPRSFKGINSLLYRNNGDGTFSDVSAATGIGALLGKALGVTIADYDNDGWVDIFVANDSVPGFLLHNDGKGRFAEVALPSGVAYNQEGAAVAGMGADFGDYDNDGWPDLFVSTLSGETYSLYRNRGDGGFDYVSAAAGIAEASLAYSGWGARLVDYDNDGWKDLFVSQGHVLDTVELTSDHLKYRQPPLLLRNDGRRFWSQGRAAGDPLASAWTGRGAAFGDLDNDGDLDIVVSNCGERPLLLRNQGGNREHWLALSLIGTRSNRDAIGARVKTVSAAGLTQHHIVTTSSSYLSASDKRLLIGLGGSPLLRLVEIRWPSGRVQRLEQVPANQALTVTEPDR